ncbi:hypothetical protein D3C73_1362600 [compost metagenome]
MLAQLLQQRFPCRIACCKIQANLCLPRGKPHERRIAFMPSGVLIMVGAEPDDTGAPHFSGITRRFAENIQQPIGIFALFGLIYIFDKFDDAVFGFLCFQLIHHRPASFLPLQTDRV